MLARANRLVRGLDYRNVVRRGFKVIGVHTVTYVRTDSGNSFARFGIIAGKNVGGAVIRNNVRRRIKAACYELVPSTPPGTDIVIRALPGSADASFASLREEVSIGVRRGCDRIC